MLGHECWYISGDSHLGLEKTKKSSTSNHVNYLPFLCPNLPWAGAALGTQGLSAFSAGAGFSSVIDACLRWENPFLLVKASHVGPFRIFWISPRSLGESWNDLKLQLPVFGCFDLLHTWNIDMNIFHWFSRWICLVISGFSSSIKPWKHTLLSNLIMVVHLVFWAFLLWVETNPLKHSKA